MLVIRLFRVGKKNQPSFKIVVTDKRKPPRAGRYIEEVGFWNPLTKEKVLKPERVKYWLSVGAKPSPTVFNLLVSEKIIEGKKIDVHKKGKEKSAPAKPTASVQMKQVEEKPKKFVSVDSASVAKTTLASPEPSAKRGSAKEAATTDKKVSQTE